MQRSVQETKEIERHKYFLSEKQGHDVGWEFAAQDWELHHAARWRRDQQSGNSSAHSEHFPTAGGCCSAHSTAVDDGCQTQSAQAVTPNGSTSRRGPLVRLLSRLFQQA